MTAIALIKTRFPSAGVVPPDTGLICEKLWNAMMQQPMARSFFIGLGLIQSYAICLLFAMANLCDFCGAPITVPYRPSTKSHRIITDGL